MRSSAWSAGRTSVCDCAALTSIDTVTRVWDVQSKFRLRVGREIGSAALIADGQHARIDGWTSLAVLLGAVGVSLGFPLADPIVGAVITIAILGIVWQSMTAVFLRVLDGVARP